MNFINDKELAKRFRAKKVPSKERFWYLFILILAITISDFVLSLPECSHIEINGWDFSGGIVQLILAIVGTIVCYKSNESGDDKEFIERYISLAFPIGVQLLLITITLIALIVTVVMSTQIVIHKAASLLTLMITAFSYLYFYWRMNSSIRIAAGSDTK